MLYITYILYVYKYMYISSMSRYIDTFFSNKHIFIHYL